MDLIKRVVALFHSQNGHRDQSGDVSSGTDCGLYRCANCDTTYVSERMDSCPECQGTVESIPDERDLGMT